MAIGSGIYYDDAYPQQPIPHVAAIKAPSQPPPSRLVPIVCADPARPIYGIEWQYGYLRVSGSYAGPGSYHPINNPPFPGSERLTASSIQQWEAESWGAQRPPPIVQPGLAIGDQPPGSAAAPEPELWGLFDPYAAQGTRVMSPALIAPAIISRPVPSDLARFYAAIGQWEPPYWNVQTAPPPATFAGSILPPVFVPFSFAELYANPELYDIPDWPTQRLTMAVQAASGLGQPPFNFQQLYALRATWSDPDWSAQVLAYATTLPKPAIVSQPPRTSLHRFYALRNIWTDPEWDAQHSARIVSIIPPPPVNPPPIGAPRGWYQQFIALQTENPTWDTQKSIPYRGWLLPDVWETVYLLVNAGLEPTIVWIPSTQAPWGFTISTDPPYGSIVPVGTPVIVYASSGLPNPAPNASITIPDVVGESIITARQQIFALGLLTMETYVASTDPAGTVETQNPGSGAEVLPGTTVTLTISYGPVIPTPTVVVPQ